ncbi:hypothetical protein [Xanthomonas sp. MUS 060]|nr:hypothetical protein [Xanthomonas sp. MUS 060]
MPNLLVRVRDALIGFDQTMVIAEAHYLLDDDGLRTQLRVGPPDGYRSKAAKSSKGIKRGGGDTWAEVE